MVREGDLLVAVDGVSTRLVSVDEAQTMLVGTQGSTCLLSLYRSEDGLYFEVPLLRMGTDKGKETESCESQDLFAQFKFNARRMARSSCIEMGMHTSVDVVHKMILSEKGLPGGDTCDATATPNSSRSDNEFFKSPAFEALLTRASAMLDKSKAISTEVTSPEAIGFIAAAAAQEAAHELQTVVDQVLSAAEQAERQASAAAEAAADQERLAKQERRAPQVQGLFGANSALESGMGWDVAWKKDIKKDIKTVEERPQLSLPQRGGGGGGVLISGSISTHAVVPPSALCNPLRYVCFSLSVECLVQYRINGFPPSALCNTLRLPPSHYRHSSTYSLYHTELNTQH